ncbi:MAG TPA: thioredoxin domain-containing protein [Ignavibacteria bacterium]|nr:thioredoxin domain-containing protein [Ignavibacteria bacterium]
MTQSNGTANKLINEKSPYLIQHAYNPVDWHPWNEETFELAKKLNKPIFLSVGYSACYWCHVMEREVFENEEIAKLMNEYFVNVKVDREERPDVDRVYMTALQAMTGSGGWPMSMFLTPDLKPFYGATYVPPRAKYGRAGFEDVIGQIHEVWTKKESEVIESGNKITDNLQNAIESRIIKENDSDLNKDILDNAFATIQKIYDEEYGGFGSGNKFPRPVVFNFLLDYYYHTGDFKSLDIVTFTLKKMYEGGMYDHLAGGFHRYSVDNIWRVPHFEKMLYDQAQLITTYVNTYLVTKNKFFLFVAEDTAHYVLDNLQNYDGGFFSAEDAESALDAAEPKVKEEGANYLWEKDEIEKILGKENSKIFNFYYGVEQHGNTLNDPHEVFGTKNVLFIANDIFDTAKHFDMTPEEIAKIIDDSRTKLLQGRTKRPKPGLDDKILTSWNGLMISALADIFKVTENEEYIDAAKMAVEFIKKYLFINKNLLHRYRDGEAKYDGALEDYAYLICGLIDLYEATFEFQYLEFAIELNEITINKFYDFENAGFYDVGNEVKDVILRTKDVYDGAEPAGNSIQVMNLLRLGYITDNKSHIENAESSLKLFSNDLNRLPFSSPQMLCALSFLLHSPKEIIISGDLKNEKTGALVKCINEKFIPNKVEMHATKGLMNISKFISNVVNNDTEPAVYVCENYKCNLPTDDIHELNKLLT